MWTRLIAWLRKTAPEEPPEQKIERLLSGLRSPESIVRLRAEQLLGRIFADPSGSDPDFLVALISAVAREGDPERLDIVPRYLLLLASGSTVRRPSPVQAAAQACLDHWQAKQAERAKSETLLRASAIPGGAEILLRPASDNPSVNPMDHLRPSVQEDPSQSPD
jgi:HEAT repeat protein